METLNICCLHQHGIKIAYGSPTEVYTIKAMSSSIPKDVWHHWLSNNRDHQMVRAGLIFEMAEEEAKADLETTELKE